MYIIQGYVHRVIKAVDMKEENRYVFCVDIIMKMVCTIYTRIYDYGLSNTGWTYQNIL